MNEETKHFGSFHLEVEASNSGNRNGKRKASEGDLYHLSLIATILG